MDTNVLLEGMLPASRKTSLLCKYKSGGIEDRSAEIQRTEAMRKRTVHNPEPCLIGVDAYDGQAPALETPAQVGQVFKLLVALGAGGGRDLFLIDSQRVTQLV
jgi:hypothetical protein